MIYEMYNDRVAKLCEGTKGLRQKVWTRTKISNPNIRYFIKIKYKNLSQFLYFSEDFGQKNALLDQKQCF